MSLEVNGKTIELDDNGNLTDPALRPKAIAFREGPARRLWEVSVSTTGVDGEFLIARNQLRPGIVFHRAVECRNDFASHSGVCRPAGFFQHPLSIQLDV